MNRIRALAQIVGFVTVGLLAVVGLLALSGRASPWELWSSVRAQDGVTQSGLSIPTTLNYQGHLREPDGSLTTGTYTITARIYSTASGGSALYTTTLPGVTVRDGLFNIVLGDAPALPESVFVNAPLYIGISLNGQAELIPRQRLHAVPWAFQASTLVNNAAAQTVQGLTSNGNVTVKGTTALNGSVTVIGGASLDGDATLSGNLVVTGTLAHPGETFVGPHFLAQQVLVREWQANCTPCDWTTFDAGAHGVPAGATAVILEYAGQEAISPSLFMMVRAQDGAPELVLGYFRAFGQGEDIGSGGQGIYPITGERTFQYKVPDLTGGCFINLIGYFK